ncbi:glycosyltransferase family 2 protein, partial [Alphaproteobacteria bacterium]|nr:glycosyltransferase family 2 protein [Alphaproteobacteria bacterium]
MMDLTIIIPCYNEAKSIPDLFNQIKLFKTKYTFLVVDNGSSDNTSSVIKKLAKPSNVRIKFKKQNTGYGAGIKFGLDFVKSEYVGWMHADLQQDIAVLANIKTDLNSIIQDSNKKKIAMKGYRTERNFFDNFFTVSVSILSSILFFKKFWDVAGQPNIFLREDTEFIKFAPNDHTFEFFV